MERHHRLATPLLASLLPILSKVPLVGRRFDSRVAKLGELLGYTVWRDALLYNGMPLLVVRGTTEGRAIMENGVYEADSIRLLERIIAPGMTFVDVGANVGQYSLVASRLVEPGGKIYAIEPTPAVIELLERNVVRNNLTNVQICRLAIIDRNGEADFYLSRARRIGTSSLFENRRSRGGKIRVSCQTLDAFAAAQGLDKIDVVKLDIEGSEYAAIEGAPGVFAGADPPVMFIEFNEYMLRRAGRSCAELYGLLRDLGYALFRADARGASEYRLEHALAQDESSKEVNVLAWPPNRKLPGFIDIRALNGE
jgi:FkbM family methyltransferase